MGLLTAIIAAVIGTAAAVKVYKDTQKAQEAAEDASRGDGLLVSKHSTNAGLRIIYGHRAVGALKAWKDVSNIAVDPVGREVIGQNKDGTDAERDDPDYDIWLDRVDVIGQGPINAVTNVEIDGEFYTAARFNKISKGVSGISHYRGIVMKGEPGQTYLSELGTVYPEWDSACVGNDVAYMNNRFRYVLEGMAFPSDPDVVMHVEGRLIWDPRKDTNYGGSGSHDLNDPDTWEYSHNPALCLLDYMLADYGMELSVTDLRLQDFIDAADFCETQVTVPAILTNTTGSGQTYYNPFTGESFTLANGNRYPDYRPWQLTETVSETSQDRFMCNLVIDPNNKVPQNVSKILETMKANMWWENGQYHLRIEDTGTSVMSLGTDEIIGGIRFGVNDRSDRMNRITVKFPNRNKRFKTDQVSWPKLDDAQYTTYLAEDGEPLHQEITLDGVTDYYQAEDIAEFIVRDSRSSLTCTLTCQPIAMLLQPGDIIDVTHPTPGWSGKLFRVRAKKTLENLDIQLDLQEYQASIYPWGTKTNEPLSPMVNLPSPYEDPADLTGLNFQFLTRVTGANTLTYNAKASWNAPNTKVDYYHVTWWDTGDTDDKYEIRVPGDKTEVTFVVPRDARTYRFEIYYVDHMGQHSDTSAYSETYASAGASPAISAVETIANDANNLAQAVSDGQIQFYYQTSAPTSGMSLGDYWIRDSDNKMHRYNGSSWVAVPDDDIQQALDDAFTAQAIADGKATLYYQTTTPTFGNTGGELSEGDAWYNPNTQLLKTVEDNLTTWNTVGNSYTDTTQLSDGAGLGNTSNWTGVTDDDGNKPADNATNNGTGGTNVGTNNVPTNAIQDLAVSTGKVAASAISKVSVASSSTKIQGNGSHADRLTCAITTTVASELLVFWLCEQSYTDLTKGYRLRVYNSNNGVSLTNRISGWMEADADYVAGAGQITQLTPGTTTVKLQWGGENSDVDLDKYTLIVIALQK